MLHIREIRDSNLGPETGYPEYFRGFPQSRQTNAGIVKLGHYRFLLNPLQFIIQLSPFQYNLITEKAS
jgi:hypothetical protein